MLFQVNLSVAILIHLLTINRAILSSHRNFSRPLFLLPLLGYHPKIFVIISAVFIVDKIDRLLTIIEINQILIKLERLGYLILVQNSDALTFSKFEEDKLYPNIKIYRIFIKMKMYSFFLLKQLDVNFILEKN